MPRFQVVICDPTTKEMRAHIVRMDSAAEAVCTHPWLLYVYNNAWVAEHVFVDGDVDSTLSNLWNNVGWIGLCVNLDEEIMNALNGGDSSASLPMQPN